MTGPPVEPSYSAVLNDKTIQANIDCVSKYLLGQGQPRRVRDVYGVLHKYVDLGVTCWSFWALLVKVLLLALNVTAIFYAFITYKSPKVQEWRFTTPTRIVIWVEFLGSCYFLLWLIWYMLRWVYSWIRELCSARDDVYVRNLETCNAMRSAYVSAMHLDFNLLIFLRYVSPPAVLAALARARRRVYSRYGTRVHRENCCLDLLCCCCFYGRLCLCSLFQSSLVLVCMGISLMAVFIKVLQLRFLGSADIRQWNVTEILLFGQFIVNMVCLDTRELSKKKAKLQFLFFGADAEKAKEERDALKLIENLALLVLRYRHNLVTALVVHHSITSDDISYLYIQDGLEEDKPRNSVRHQYKKRSSPSSSNSGGGSGSIPDIPMSPPPGAAAANFVGSHWGAYHHPDGTPSGAAAAAAYYSDPHRQSYPPPAAMLPPQVVVEMSPGKPAGGKGAPPRGRGGSYGSGSGQVPYGQHDGGCSDVELPMPPMGPPSAPPMMSFLQAIQGGGAAGEGGSMRRFPHDFYSNGYAVGAPLRGSANRPQPLQHEYGHKTWGA